MGRLLSRSPWLLAACIISGHMSSSPWGHILRSAGSILCPCPNCLHELHPWSIPSPLRHPQPPGVSPAPSDIHGHLGHPQAPRASPSTSSIPGHLSQRRRWARCPVGQILPATTSPGLLCHQTWFRLRLLLAAGSCVRGSRSTAGEQVRAGRASELICLVFQGHRGGGKERKESEEKKKLTQKPQGIFCLFRILGREKIATVIQSIQDNNSLFTVCMQRWQAGSTAQGRGMRNLPQPNRFCLAQQSTGWLSWPAWADREGRSQASLPQ